jgi:hypothetical protein
LQIIRQSSVGHDSSLSGNSSILSPLQNKFQKSLQNRMSSPENPQPKQNKRNTVCMGVSSNPLQLNKNQESPGQKPGLFH